jgi:beta-ureidopropionase / N-carbamoyl-L-amino-acid hydrolase
VMAGSHLDSQPQGGRFDGALGVVAASAAALALRDQARVGALRSRCNLAVVDWTSEEGARFQPSLLGSGVFTGAIGLSEALARTDGGGVALGAALQAIGYFGDGALPRPAA